MYIYKICFRMYGTFFPYMRKHILGYKLSLFYYLKYSYILCVLSYAYSLSLSLSLQKSCQSVRSIDFQDNNMILQFLI
jgi:hypothetical protein